LEKWLVLMRFWLGSWANVRLIFSNLIVCSRGELPNTIFIVWSVCTEPCKCGLL
jgi:hypothetical protein